MTTATDKAAKARAAKARKAEEGRRAQKAGPAPLSEPVRDPLGSPRRNDARRAGIVIGLAAATVLLLLLVTAATTSCAVDADCPPGFECVNGICTAVPECAVNADCPPGQQCDNGVCIDIGCAIDADCPPGFECVNAVCTPIAPECAVDADCDPGEECVDGVCTPIAPECAVDADCLPGEQCLNGECVPAGFCNVDADCEPGQQCLDGECVDVEPPPDVDPPQDDGPEILFAPCNFWALDAADDVNVGVAAQAIASSVGADSVATYALAILADPYNARFIDGGVENWDFQYDTFAAQLQDPVTGDRQPAANPVLFVRPVLHLPCLTVDNGGIPPGGEPGTTAPECDPYLDIPDNWFDAALAHVEVYMPGLDPTPLMNEAGYSPVIPASLAGRKSYYRTAALRYVENQFAVNNITPPGGQWRSDTGTDGDAGTPADEEWPGGLNAEGVCIVTRPSQVALWAAVEDRVQYWSQFWNA